MAIAPSELGRLIAETIGGRVDGGAPSALHDSLRQLRLITRRTTLTDIESAVEKVRREPNYADPFNSPSERLRERLRPHLTGKGERWAEPLRSLDIPDHSEPIATRFRNWLSRRS